MKLPTLGNPHPDLGRRQAIVEAALRRLHCTWRVRIAPDGDRLVRKDGAGHAAPLTPGGVYYGLVTCGVPAVTDSLCEWVAQDLRKEADRLWAVADSTPAAFARARRSWITVV